MRITSTFAAGLSVVPLCTVPVTVPAPATDTPMMQEIIARIQTFAPRQTKRDRVAEVTQRENLMNDASLGRPGGWREWERCRCDGPSPQGLGQLPLLGTA